MQSVLQRLMLRLKAALDEEETLIENKLINLMENSDANLIGRANIPLRQFAATLKEQFPPPLTVHRPDDPDIFIEQLARIAAGRDQHTTVNEMIRGRKRRKLGLIHTTKTAQSNLICTTTDDSGNITAAALLELGTDAARFTAVRVSLPTESRLMKWCVKEQMGFDDIQTLHLIMPTVLGDHQRDFVVYPQMPDERMLELLEIYAERVELVRTPTERQKTLITRTAMALDDASQTVHLQDDETLWPRHAWPDDAVVYSVIPKSGAPFLVCTFDRMLGYPVIFNAKETNG